MKKAESTAHMSSPNINFLLTRIFKKIRPILQETELC